MCEIADQSGCSIKELTDKISESELNMRITARLMQSGYTYDREKIQAAEQQRKKAETDAFLERAHKSWNK